MDDLTPRQREVLDFLSEYAEDHGFPPTLREIAAKLKVNGTLGVMKHLDALEKKGRISRISGSSRGIQLPGGISQAAPVPVVGTVRAGMPEPAVEDIQEYFSIDRAKLRTGGRFFLRVKGDSMINASIRDGDLALVRPQPTAENREIVVAMVDGEATLKRFYRERGRIRLQPENPNLEPIYVNEGDADVVIVGKVVGIYRDLA